MVHNSHKSHNSHVLYGVDTKKTYYACHRSCQVCQEWNKPGNLWKFWTFFPYHCAGCQYAGYPDDFVLIDNCVFVCQECKKAYLKRIRNLRNHIR